MFGRRLLLTFPRLSGRTSVRITPQSLNKGRFAPTRDALNRRFFATPGRPKGAVGEASKPIKRTRAAAANSPKKTASTSKAKKTTAPKKEKKAAVAKKPVRKPLTEEKKAALKKSAEKAKKAALRQSALDPPSHANSSSAWNELVAERLKGNSAKVGSSEAVKDLAREYKALSPAELEHYNHLAVVRKAAYKDAFNEFLKKHTPAEIVAANVARTKLRGLDKKDGKKASNKWRAIEDPRIPRPPPTSFTKFVVERHSSGDFKHITVTDAAKLLSTEWKELNASSKQRYIDAYTREKREFETNYEAVVGVKPASASTDGLAAVAA